MSKRLNGEGMVRKHPTRDLYEARYSFIDPTTGKRKVGSVYGKTAKAAREKLRDVLDRIRDEKAPRDSRLTVASWVSEWQSGILVRSDRKPTTKELYRRLGSTHLMAAPFGNIELAKVRRSHIDQLIQGLRDKGLSDSTVRSIYAVLNAALEDARIDSLLAVNPMREVKRPSNVSPEAKHLTPAEVRHLLDSAVGLRYKSTLDLMAGTGLRRGEALALKWSDIDLTKKSLHVRATVSRVDGKLLATAPKTTKSRREVPLTDGLVAMLKAHRKTQVAERLVAGTEWQDLGLVFTTELGGYVDPRNLLRSLKSAARYAGIEDVGLHTLRHSAATAMLEANIPPHVVSRILGHSSVAITLDIYGHVNDESQREALVGLSEVMGL